MASEVLEVSTRNESRERKRKRISSFQGYEAVREDTTMDVPGDKIRQYSPLADNGPDPVQDKELVTFKWLKDKCHSKKVPIKAMFLDQAVLVWHWQLGWRRNHKK